MWNWNHLGEIKCTYGRHLRDALSVALLMGMASIALTLHAILPFWQQPIKLRIEAVRNSLQQLSDERSGE